MLRRKPLGKIQKAWHVFFFRILFLCAPIKWPYIYKAQIVICPTQWKFLCFSNSKCKVNSLYKIQVFLTSVYFVMITVRLDPRDS